MLDSFSSLAYFPSNELLLRHPPGRNNEDFLPVCVVTNIDVTVSDAFQSSGVSV